MGSISKRLKSGNATEVIREEVRRFREIRKDK